MILFTIPPFAPRPFFSFTSPESSSYNSSPRSKIQGVSSAISLTISASRRKRNSKDSKSK
jgi:hypothetical protein